MGKCSHQPLFASSLTNHIAKLLSSSFVGHLGRFSSKICPRCPVFHSKSINLSTARSFKCHKTSELLYYLKRFLKEIYTWESCRSSNQFCQLYPSLRGAKRRGNLHTTKKALENSKACCGSRGSRTPDPLLVRQML